MTNLADLRAKAEAARDSGDWEEDLTDEDAAYIAAANPQTILRLLDRLERAEEVLKPFAALLDPSMDEKPDDWPVWGFNQATITYGDLRRAALAERQAPR